MAGEDEPSTPQLGRSSSMMDFDTFDSLEEYTPIPSSRRRRSVLTRSQRKILLASAEKTTDENQPNNSLPMGSNQERGLQTPSSSLSSLPLSSSSKKRRASRLRRANTTGTMSTPLAPLAETNETPISTRTRKRRSLAAVYEEVSPEKRIKTPKSRRVPKEQNATKRQNGEIVESSAENAASSEWICSTAQIQERAQLLLQTQACESPTKQQSVAAHVLACFILSFEKAIEGSHETSRTTTLWEGDQGNKVLGILALFLSQHTTDSVEANDQAVSTLIKTIQKSSPRSFKPSKLFISVRDERLEASIELDDTQKLQNTQIIADDLATLIVFLSPETLETWQSTCSSALGNDYSMQEMGREQASYYSVLKHVQDSVSKATNEEHENADANLNDGCRSTPQTTVPDSVNEATQEECENLDTKSNDSVTGSPQSQEVCVSVYSTTSPNDSMIGRSILLRGADETPSCMLSPCLDIPTQKLVGDGNQTPASVKSTKQQVVSSILRSKGSSARSQSSCTLIASETTDQWHSPEKINDRVRALFPEEQTVDTVCISARIFACVSLLLDHNSSPETDVPDINPILKYLKCLVRVELKSIHPSVQPPSIQRQKSVLICGTEPPVDRLVGSEVYQEEAIEALRTAKYELDDIIARCQKDPRRRGEIKNSFELVLRLFQKESWMLSCAKAISENTHVNRVKRAAQMYSKEIKGMLSRIEGGADVLFIEKGYAEICGQALRYHIRMLLNPPPPRLSTNDESYDEIVSRHSKVATKIHMCAQDDDEERIDEERLASLFNTALDYMCHFFSLEALTSGGFSPSVPTSFFESEPSQRSIPKTKGEPLADSELDQVLKDIDQAAGVLVTQRACKFLFQLLSLETVQQEIERQGGWERVESLASYAYVHDLYKLSPEDEHLVALCNVEELFRKLEVAVELLERPAKDAEEGLDALALRFRVNTKSGNLHRRHPEIKTILACLEDAQEHYSTFPLVRESE